MFKPILLASDGSEASAHAAQLALDLARVHGARLTAPYVIDPYPYLGIGETNPMGFQAYMSAAHDHAALAHAHVPARCDRGGMPVPVALRLAEDARAGEEIVRVAKEAGADITVVSSHGRRGIARMLLGSVAGSAVMQSPVPVWLRADRGTEKRLPSEIILSVRPRRTGGTRGRSLGPRPACAFHLITVNLPGAAVARRPRASLGNYSRPAEGNEHHCAGRNQRRSVRRHA